MSTVYNNQVAPLSICFVKMKMFPLQHPLITIAIIAVYTEWSKNECTNCPNPWKCSGMLLASSSPVISFLSCLTEFDTALAWRYGWRWILNRLRNDFPLVTHSSYSIYKSVSSQGWQVKQVTRRQLLFVDCCFRLGVSWHPSSLSVDNVIWHKTHPVY